MARTGNESNLGAGPERHGMARIPRGSAILPPPMRFTRLARLASVLALAVALALGAPAEAASRRKRSKKRRPRPAPAAVLAHFGPPVPSDRDYQRAAGICVDYAPGHYVVVAEVGEKGRAFRIDADTVLGLSLAKGSRIRILYTDGPEGPLAHKLQPGPVEPRADGPVVPATVPPN